MLVALKLLMPHSQRVVDIDEITKSSGQFFEIIMFGLKPHRSVTYQRAKPTQWTLYDIVVTCTTVTRMHMLYRVVRGGGAFATPPPGIDFPAPWQLAFLLFSMGLPPPSSPWICICPHLKVAATCMYMYMYITYMYTCGRLAMGIHALTSMHSKLEHNKYYFDKLAQVQCTHTCSC